MKRSALVALVALLAVAPALMAPSGFPSRPTFQREIVRNDGQGANYPQVTAYANSTAGYSAMQLSNSTGTRMAEWLCVQSAATPVYGMAVSTCGINMVGATVFTLGQSDAVKATLDANGNWTHAGELRAVKTSTTTRTSTTTLADDPDLVLTIPNITGSKVWKVEGFLYVCDAVGSAGGFKFTMNYTGTSFTGGNKYIATAAFNTATPTVGTANLYTAGVFTGVVTDCNNWDPVEIQSTVTAISSSGVLSVQWAQQSSDANGVSIRAGSWLTARLMN